MGTIANAERERFSAYHRHKDDYPVYSETQLKDAKVKSEKSSALTNCLTRDIEENSYATEMTTQFIPRQLPQPDDDDVEFVEV